MSNYESHSRRWLKRIRVAEGNFEIIENGLHEVLNYIEDNDLDSTIHKKLMELVELTDRGIHK